MSIKLEGRWMEKQRKTKKRWMNCLKEDMILVNESRHYK